MQRYECNLLDNLETKPSIYTNVVYEIENSKSIRKERSTQKIVMWKWGIYWFREKMNKVTHIHCIYTHPQTNVHELYTVYAIKSKIMKLPKEISGNYL